MSSFHVADWASRQFVKLNFPGPMLSKKVMIVRFSGCWLGVGPTFGGARNAYFPARILFFRYTILLKQNIVTEGVNRRFSRLVLTERRLMV